MSKLKLTPEEIQQYNLYKQKISEAKSKIEILAYQKKAEEILQLGRSRYIKALEQSLKLDRSDSEFQPSITPTSYGVGPAYGK
jgi:hypothetical protein